MINKDRLYVIAAISVYAILFRTVWIEWLHPSYGYFGFSYAPALGFEQLAFLVAVLPATWMPISLVRPSNAMYWLMFLFVYVPSAWGPALMAIGDLTGLMVFMSILPISFFGLGMMGKLPLVGLLDKSVKASWFWGVFSLSYVALFIWILAKAYGQMRLVPFSEVNYLRGEAYRFIDKSYVGYAIGIISGCYNPFLIAYGLSYGKNVLVILGIAGQLAIYMTMGMRSVMLSPVLILVLLWIARGGARSFGRRIAVWFVCLFGSFTALGLVLGFAGIDYANSAIKQMMALLFMRTVGFPGLLMGLYLEFFQQHPLTYFSHVLLVRLFVEYPYKLTLGEEVGSYFMGGSGINMNANLLATDGLAALGVVGLPVICMICGAVFLIIDSVAARHGKIFPTLILSVSAISMCNASLFTTLLTGGLGFIILFLYILPAEDYGQRLRLTTPINTSGGGHEL